MKCPKGHEAVVIEKGATDLERDYLRCVTCGWTWRPGDEIALVKPPKTDSGGSMAYNLDPEKEEEVKALLKTHSQREIVKITGVAKNTITRIRNENLTESERVEFEKKSLLRGRNKRELKKVEGIISNIIPSGERGEVMENLLKKCSKCDQEKPATNEFFSKNKATKDSLEY